MADKITAQDIISPEVIKEFQNLNKELQNTLTTMSTLSKEFIKSDTALKGASKSVNDLQKAEQKSNQEKKLLTETEKQLINIEKQQQKINETLSGSYNNLNAQLIKARLEYKLLDETQRNSKGGKEALKNIQGLDKQLKDFDKTMGQSQRNVGNYGSAFDSIPGPIGMAINSIKSFGKQLLMLLANPIVAIIAGITAAFYALYNTFKSTDSGGTEVAARMEQIKAIVDILRQKLVNLIEWISGIIKKFTDWKTELEKTHPVLMKVLKAINLTINPIAQVKKGVELLGKVFKGTNSQLDAATKAAYNYAYALDTLNDSEAAYISKAAENKLKIAKLEYTAQDRSIETSERRKALLDAIAIGEEEVKKNKEFAQKRFDIEVNKLAGIYGLNASQIKEFIALDDNQTAEALKNDKQIADFRNKLGDERAKKLEELYAKIFEFDQRFFEENKRNISRLSGFDEELRKERERGAELAAQYQRDYYAEITDLADKQNTEAEKDIDDFLKSEDKRLSDHFDNEKKWSEKRIDLNLEEGKKIINNEREKQKKLAKIEEEKLKLQKDNVIGILNLENTLLDAKIANNEYAKKKELEAAGDNEKRKEQIEKKYDRKNAELKRRQAMIDKAAALFDIAINTAVQVSKAAIPLKPWIIAQGSIQAGIVAAKPIPKFAIGVRNFEGGLAEVGEQGSELIKTKEGNLFITPNEATKMILPKGSDVFTHTETKEMLGNGVSIDKFDELIKEQKETRKALSKQTKNNQRIKYIDKYFRI